MPDYISGERALRQEINELKRQIRQLGTATIQNSSVGRAGIRVHSGGIVLIENGGLDVTGTASVLGILAGSGEFDWEGSAELSGPVKITGPFTVDGLTELLKTLSVKGAGKIQVGTAMTLDPSSGSGAVLFNTGVKLEADGSGVRLISGVGPRVFVFPSSAGMQFDPTRAIQVNSSGTHVVGMLWADGGLQTTGSKSFIMEHPTKGRHWLRHGATESPVSGIEYWGEVTLSAEGEATVELPEYFEALAKPEGRTVLVTGRGFVPDWTDIDDGAFVITGEAGRRASWLVKAERFGGDFLVEERQPDWVAAESSS